jgi:hypothetical protein
LCSTCHTHLILLDLITRSPKWDVQVTKWDVQVTKWDVQVTKWDVEVTKLRIMSFSPLPCYLSYLRPIFVPKYSHCTILSRKLLQISLYCDFVLHSDL